MYHFSHFIKTFTFAVPYLKHLFIVLRIKAVTSVTNVLYCIFLKIIFFCILFCHQILQSI